ncbi:MAG: C2H2-type zinc finger protein [Kangiellaceae bacterium]|jgi:hypothetical protein|nr:C2H2-type zinc finger protein [Kangiellaceae bacterium]
MDEPNPTPSGAAPEEKKKNRRSRHEQEGRDHECKTCGKTYLSYPALYTHIKTKHSPEDLESVKSGGVNGTRGRGRPKKESPAPEKKRKLESEDILKSPEFSGGPTDPLDHFSPDDENNVLKARVSSLKDMDDLNIPELENCNKIISAYLISVAKGLKSDAYKHFVIFAENFRRCLNIKGWEASG